MKIAALATGALLALSPVLATSTNDASTSYTAPTVAQAESVSPYLLTTLSASIKLNGNYVVGVAKNEFTLFPSTVHVLVELFYSQARPSSLDDMEFITSASTPDLDMGDELTCKAEMKVGYWYCRVTSRNASSTYVLVSISSDGTITDARF